MYPVNHTVLVYLSFIPVCSAGAEGWGDGTYTDALICFLLKC